MVIKKTSQTRKIGKKHMNPFRPQYGAAEEN